MRAIPVLLAVLCFTLLGLYQLYPAWLALDHAVVGEWAHPDLISNHWLYLWIVEQLSSGHGILHNDRYYFPVGDAPWLAGNGSDALPFLPLGLLLPWPASVTVWALLTVVLNGVAGLMLARKVGASWPGAIIGGSAVAFSPYVAHELAGGHFAQAPLYWMGFFLVAWLSLLESAPTTGSTWRVGRRTTALAVGAGALFGVTSFIYWYYGLWAAWLGGLAFWAKPRWRVAPKFLVAAAVTTVPPLAIFLANWGEIVGAEEQIFPHPIARESALAFTFPLWGGGGWWGEVLLPLTLPVLAAVALAPRLRAAARERGAGARGWLGAARGFWRSLQWWERFAVGASALFYALALGPYILLPGGRETGIPGPFLLLYGLPGPLRRYWWPYRHIAVLTLTLAPLAAVGADRVIAWLRGQVDVGLQRWVPAIAVAAVVVLLPAELSGRSGRVAVPISYWEAPEFYISLAIQPGDVLVELPIAPDLVSGQQTLSYQWVHGKTLVNGHALWVDRVRPDAWDAWVADNSFLTEIQVLEMGELMGPFVFRGADLVALRDAGVRQIVINAEYLPGDLERLLKVYEGLFDALFGEPVVESEDGAAMAWDLANWTGLESVETLPFRLPSQLRGQTSDGRMPSLVPQSSLGWRTVGRSFPPDLPGWGAAVEDEGAE